MPLSLFRLPAVKTGWRAGALVAAPKNSGGGGGGEFGGGKSSVPILDKTNE